MNERMDKHLNERSDGKSITNELREWGCQNLYLRAKFEELTVIADRIDAEHEREISRAAQLLADAEKDRDFNYANWQDCKQKVLQHNITMDELSAEIERLKDELAHRIEPPKDADGEPIHIGDVMEWVPYDSSYPSVIRKVVAVGVCVFFAWSDEKQGYAQYEALAYRHHPAPTVEDVLWEMADRCYADEDEPRDRDAIVAEYAAKLCLIDNGKEQ